MESRRGLRHWLPALQCWQCRQPHKQAPKYHFLPVQVADWSRLRWSVAIVVALAWLRMDGLHLHNPDVQFCPGRSLKRCGASFRFLHLNQFARKTPRAPFRYARCTPHYLLPSERFAYYARRHTIHDGVKILLSDRNLDSNPNQKSEVPRFTAALGKPHASQATQQAERKCTPHNRKGPALSGVAPLRKLRQNARR